MEIPSCEVDLERGKKRKKKTLRRPEHVEIPSCEVDLRLFQVEKAEKVNFDPRPPIEISI